MYWFGLSEGALRLSVFLSVLLMLMVAEAIWPRKELRIGRRRWVTNIAILVIGSLVIRLLAAISASLVAVGVAVWAEQRGIGVFNMVNGPVWIEFLLAIVLLDGVIWAQHRIFHRIPLLWRFHRVHHADRDIDTTTALRFHPAEIAASMLIKLMAVLVLGASAPAVLLFEILLNGCAMFNHANLKLPGSVDRVLRILIVTPDMHRVHHSVRSDEHHQNFGFNLSIWDRWFGTYVAQPREGHDAMLIGLPEYQMPGPEQLAWNLMLPTKTLSKRD